GLITTTFWKDVVYSSGDGKATATIDAPVIFMGFGIDAPEEGWDDFKGIDCKGKFLIVLVNEPASTPGEPKRFDGPNMTIHGRWRTKFEEATKRGAAGVLVVHDSEGAAYHWSVARNGFEGERFALTERRGVPLVGWLHQDLARTLLKASGQDLDALRKAAERKDFRPIPLTLKAKGNLTSTVRSFPQYNVVGVLPGTDPKLKEEAVIYSAHWDHLGIQNGNIYCGAIDNGSAIASLLAVAKATVPYPTRRSQIFMLTCGEEQGLLGAEAYVANPLWPLAKTVAALNFESLNWVGPARDIEFLGGERSTLLELAREVGKPLNLAPMEGQTDPAGLYFRSDHYPFAAVGIPALSPGFSLEGDRDYLDQPEANRAKGKTYLDKYHQVLDTYDPTWDLRGMVHQAQFILNLGRVIADADGRPRMLK
ncbi:MAG: M28 family peptidase, partial [Holophaga sp.]|nr:M28 family peptidase [Holophaga sp.]